MLVLGCGTISAPKEELPTGETRQYSIVEILSDYSKLRFHLRKAADQPPGLHVWMPGNIRQNYDKSYMDIIMDRAIYIEKEKRVQAAAEQLELSRKLAEAEELVARKEYEKALDVLETLSADDPFVRRLTVECLFQLEKDDDIVQYIKEPKTLTEFTYLSEALWRKKELPVLRESVEKCRGNPEIAKSEQFKRIISKLKDCGS
jgi:DNA polymerase III delta prime subunit